MSQLGIEEVLDPTIAYIIANSAAKLQEMEGRSWTTELDLPNFVAVRLSDPQLEREPAFPVLYAVPIDEAPVVGAGAGVQPLAAKFTVVWVAIAYQPPSSEVTAAELAKRAAIRYIICVRELLRELHSHPTTPYHWTLGRPRFGRTYTSDAGEFLSDAQLEATIEHKGA